MSPPDLQIEPHASAELRDVFVVTNRGTVLVVAHVDGTIHIGNELVLEDRRALVSGIEFIRFPDHTAHPSDTLGLLVDDPESEPYRLMIGHRAKFRKGA